MLTLGVTYLVPILNRQKNEVGSKQFFKIYFMLKIGPVQPVNLKKLCNLKDQLTDCNQLFKPAELRPNMDAKRFSPWWGETILHR